MTTKADASVAVHREADAGAPAQPIGGSGQLFDDRLALDPRESAQLRGEQLRLEVPLRLARKVLPVAASTAARSGVRARRCDAFGRRLEDLDGVSANEVCAVLGDPGTHELTGSGMADEGDPAVGCATDTATARRERANS